MTIDSVKTIVGDLPHMSREQAQLMSAFIRDQKIESILELGFKHGVSTCYIADCLAGLGKGSIVTIDLESARDLVPNIEVLLTETGQRERVEIYYEPTSYTWRMMKFLEADPSPRFDLCYVDGAHSWFVDALAFFLADRLLKPGGWVIFDDLEWTYATSSMLKDSEQVNQMPLEERITPQIMMVYELLVKTHPGYDTFRVHNGWAFARKRSESATDGSRELEVVTETIIQTEKIEIGIGAFLIRVINKLRK